MTLNLVFRNEACRAHVACKQPSHDDDDVDGSDDLIMIMNLVLGKETY